MKIPHSHFIFLALLSLLLSPLAVAHASPAPADSVYFCLLPFDYEQGQRDHIRPVAKRLSDCAFCDLFDALNDDDEAPSPSGKAQVSLAAPAAPTNLRFDAPTDSSCTVRWDAVEGATDYDVNYKPAVGGRWTNAPHRGVGLYNTIHDLAPNTEYRWAVRAENGDGASEWIHGPNFTTRPSEEDGLNDVSASPTNLRFDAPTDSSCTVRWDAVEGATDYDVNYKPAVGGRWTNAPHRGVRLYNTIHDLAPNTEYRWAVRAENGDGASEWVFGPNFTTDYLILEPSQPPRTVQENFELTAFYQQWIDVEGYPVVASENVNPYAVKEAAWLIRRLMSHRPDVLQAMVQNKASHSVMAYNEMTTQIPEHSHLRPDFFWDRRARGLGGRESSSGEENLLNYPGDPYDGYHVMIHEFSHSVHLDGLNTVDPDFDDRLRKAFDAAIAKGLWKGTYASSNKQEYWAEGVQAWFHAQFEFIDIDTRAELKDYDPELAKLIAEVFGDTDWRYTPPATRIHLPHLQGFDPQDSPTFEWPPELVACYEQLFEPDGDGGDKWVNLEPYDSRLRSPRYETSDTAIIFVNRSGATLSYYWIDADGTEIYFGYLTFAGTAVPTFVGHVFLIKDQHGNDLGVFRTKEKTGRVYIGPAQAKLVAMAQDRLGLSDVPQLQQNAPNPFNSQTVLSYFLPAAGPTRVEVFALTGQRVAVLRQGPQSAGHHRLHWNGLDAEGRPLASGIYLYRLATDFGVLTRKLMLLR